MGATTQLFLVNLPGLQRRIMGVQTDRDNQALGMAASFTKWICGCGTLDEGCQGLELCPKVRELEPLMQQSRERGNMLLGNETEIIDKWLICSKVVLKDFKLAFILFHTVSYFFIPFHIMYRTETVWKSVKKYELRISSKKFIELHHTSIPEPESCKSSTCSCSSRPKNLIHVFPYFFIVFTVGIPVGVSVKKTIFFLHLWLRQVNTSSESSRLDNFRGSEDN